MNRYPPCPLASKVFGLVPHTDSDFLTILFQDQVGGLQLLKDGKWIKVKPNPQALIINIGDLFQVRLYLPETILFNRSTLSGCMACLINRMVNIITHHIHSHIVNFNVHKS